MQQVGKQAAYTKPDFTLRNLLCTRRQRRNALFTLTLLTLGGIHAYGRTAASSDVARPTNAQETVSITEMTTKFDDFQATLRMNKCDLRELEKIGADFQRSYQIQDILKSITLQYKQPGKLRIYGKNKILGEATIVMNGAMRSFRVPTQPRKVEDLRDAPGKRQSLLEYGGLLSPDTLTFMDSKFVRQDVLDGLQSPVFDLTYKGAAGGSHYRVWFSPKTHITLKREWYDRDNKLKATFYYQEPKEITGGVWLPTQIEVKNADGGSAAITSVENAQINQGLPDDLFAIAAK